MLIRRAYSADATALAEIGAATYCETFQHLYAEKDLQDYLRTAHTPAIHHMAINNPALAVWIVTDAQGYAVAYASAGPCKLPVTNLEATAGELRQVYVRKSQQGSGIGRQLIHLALEWLSTRHTPLYVGVWSENTGAQRLYSRFGFSKISEYGFKVGSHVDRDFIFRMQA
jgi:diamine N-acetyltransferase